MFITYKLADGSTALVEVTEEVAAYIFENDRETENADRRERYHTPYHLDGLDYEGDSLAYRLTPEELYIRKEDAAHIRDTLSGLTDAQLRRLMMKAEGMTLRQIAEAEGKSFRSIQESLNSAKKKFRKNF